MYIFKTNRTNLRPFTANDYNDLLEIMSNEEVMKFTGFREVQEPKRISSLLEKWIEEGHSSLGVWAAEENLTGDFLGWFMLKITVCEDPELGFMITHSKWGSGFATEIAHGLVNYAFKSLKQNRIIASTDSENQASIKVLEKIGMTRSSESYSDKDVLYFEIRSKNS